MTAMARHRHPWLRAGATLLLGAALGGCTGIRPNAPGAEVFEATLSGAQEVPAVASPGTGRAEVELNEGNSVIRWRVTYEGLTGPVVAAHLHGPATPTQNAAVAIPFAGPLRSPMRGELRITPEQALQLMSGQWYVNLHTDRYPQGELRGQLRPRP
jgi:hypothetical protein